MHRAVVGPLKGLRRRLLERSNLHPSTRTTLCVFNGPAVNGARRGGGRSLALCSGSKRWRVVIHDRTRKRDTMMAHLWACWIVDMDN